MPKNLKTGLIAGTCVALGLTAVIVTANVNFDTQMGKAQQYISNAEYSKAAEILDEHKSKNGSQEDVYLLYADYYIAQEEYKSAVDILKEGAGKAQNTDKINAKLNEINELYIIESSQPPVESSDNSETPPTESTTTSEAESSMSSVSESTVSSVPESSISSVLESSVSSVPESSRTESNTISSVPPQTSSTTISKPQVKPSVVYIAASGKGSKYHKSSKCSGMNGNVIAMTREEAISKGYTACKKNSCYG